jgi:sugar-specific transcriptional regulator TrmB
MKVVAIDPTEAFEELESSLDRMIAELEARYTAPARETEAVSLVRSRATILRYVEEVIETAEYELALSLTPALLDRFETELGRAIDHGVSVDVIVTPGEEAPDLADYDYGTIATNARARRGIATPVIAVADGEYSVYATQDALRDDRERYGVIFNRSALGFLLSGFYGTVLWTTSEPLHSDGTDRSWPRIYASIRRCVKDLQTVEGPLYATVSGRDVLTGDPRVVRGRIIEVTFEDTEEVASLTVESEAGATVTVGGQVATLEDVEAHELRIGKDGPPEIE